MELQEFFEKSGMKKELAFLEAFDSQELEKTVSHLKAQLVDLQEGFEDRRDQSVEKVLEVKTALQETQQALQDLQKAVEALQKSGQRVKASLSVE